MCAYTYIHTALDRFTAILTVLGFACTGCSASASEEVSFILVAFLNQSDTPLLCLCFGTMLALHPFIVQKSYTNSTMAGGLCQEFHHAILSSCLYSSCMPIPIGHTALGRFCIGKVWSRFGGIHGRSSQTYVWMLGEV